MNNDASPARCATEPFAAAVPPRPSLSELFIAWQVALAGGLVPVTLGLTAASAIVVATAADDTRVAVGITVATALMTYWIRVNPLWIFAVAALLGLSGVV